MPDEEKNNLMGRDLKVVTPHKGFDNRPENPRYVIYYPHIKDVRY